MQALFGWHVRWPGAPARDSGHTIHVGSDDHYIALHRARGRLRRRRFRQGSAAQPYRRQVDDLDAVEAKVVAAGLTPFSMAITIRAAGSYFLSPDPDGIECEVVSYRRRGTNNR